jgi:hypothetical protein
VGEEDIGHGPLLVGSLARFQRFTYWSGSPIRPGFSTYIMVTAALMVLAMWVFPEAGVKKGYMTRAK